MVKSKVRRMRFSLSIHGFLNRLGPYQSLLILAVPLAIVEPLKLIALLVVGGGHFIAGLVIMICAYAGSLFITERLFVVLKPKLLSLPWFAVAWQWFVTIRGKLVYWLRRTWTRLRCVARRVTAGTPKLAPALVDKIGIGRHEHAVTGRSSYAKQSAERNRVE
jgi:hypothetical protein